MLKNDDSGHNMAIALSAAVVTCTSPKQDQASQIPITGGTGNLQVPTLTVDLFILFEEVATGRVPSFSG